MGRNKQEKAVDVKARRKKMCMYVGESPRSGLLSIAFLLLTHLAASLNIWAAEKEECTQIK